MSSKQQFLDECALNLGFQEFPNIIQSQEKTQWNIIYYEKTTVVKKSDINYGNIRIIAYIAYNIHTVFVKNYKNIIFITKEQEVIKINQVVL